MDRTGSTMALICPVPFCGTAKQKDEITIEGWTDKESKNQWQYTPGQKQAKAKPETVKSIDRALQAKQEHKHHEFNRRSHIRFKQTEKETLEHVLFKYYQQE